MPCYSPNVVGVGEDKPNGKMNLIWRGNLAGMQTIGIPCAKCVGCKLEYSRNMALRCMCEADSHEKNSFVTLTFDDDKLPDGFDGNVSLLDHQLFMKRLRKHFGNGIRFFMAAEYGGMYGRPHYHYLLFNLDFPDKVLVTVRNGNRLYTSSSLEKIWPFGFSSIGDVSYESASYVARYCLKKVDDGKVHRFKDPDTGVRMRVDKFTGEMRVDEFTQMSRGGRPGKDGRKRFGIGEEWFSKFSSDLFPSDQFVHAGKVSKPSRYFLKLLELRNPQMFDSVKSDRADNIPSWTERTGERLRVKERVKLAQIKSLKRSL